MNYLKNVFQFYIYSNIHVSIAVYSLLIITGVYFEVNTSKSALFVSLATFVAYNWIRFLKYNSKNLKQALHVWFGHNKRYIFFLNLVAIVALIIVAKEFKTSSFLTVLPFAILTFFYMLPGNGFNKSIFSLRSLPSFKIFCIAVSWSGLAVLFPLVEASIEIELKELLFFIQQCLFVLVLTLPFDIRDMSYDKKELKTLPQVLGVPKTKLFGLILAVLSSTIGSFLFEGFLLYTLVVIVALLILFLVKSTKQQTEYYAAFWVEGIPIIWMLLLCDF